VFKDFKIVLPIVLIIVFSIYNISCVSSKVNVYQLTAEELYVQKQNEEIEKRRLEKEKSRIILKYVYKIVVNSHLRASLCRDNSHNYLFFKYLKIAENELYSNPDLTYYDVTLYIDYYKTMLFDAPEGSYLLSSIQHMCHDLNLEGDGIKEPISHEFRKFLLTVLLAIEIEAEKAVKDMMI